MEQKPTLKAEETKRCPKCSESIQKKAKKCKHCGADLRNWFLKHKIITGFLVLFVLIVVAEGSSDKETNTANNSSQQPKEEESKNETSAPVAETAIKEAVSYKELESYEKGNQLWKNIVIPVGTSQEDLKALAVSIHKKDPSGYYHIFNDDAKFQEYKNWDLNYGKLKDKDGKIKEIQECIDVEYCRSLMQKQQYPYPFPEEWASKHDMGNIQQMYSGDTRKMEWQLVGPMGENVMGL